MISEISFPSDDQHGFRPGLSTTTNLVVFSKFVNSNLNSNIQTDVIYTDFSKAFDKVNHSILMYKLKNFGFNANLLLCVSVLSLLVVHNM